MKNRTPRKLKKKSIKRGILIYDFASLPRTNTAKDVMKNFINLGIVFYDSDGNNNISGKDCHNIPQVVNNVRGVRIVDLSKN